MDEATARLRGLSDEGVRALPSMLGDGARGMLDAALSARGMRVVGARPGQVTWRPGRSLAVRYEARVVPGPGKPARAEQLVATTDAPPPGGATVISDGAANVAVWPLADDPWLPGLRVAMDRERVRELLGTLGVKSPTVRTVLRAYRPGRRAVVEVEARGVSLFVKVVRPSDVAALQARHRALSGALPVPHSHGWSSEFGIVVLEHMPGITLRAALADKRERNPEPGEIAALLDAMPALADAPVRGAPSSLVNDHVRLLRCVVPDMRDRLEALTREIAERARREEGPDVPVHGDLHEAQLLTTSGRITGLLDVDTVGRGRRMDDWAALAGHLSTWAEAARGSARERARAYGLRVLAGAESEVDPAALRIEIAAVILGLATGPFRVQSPSWPKETRDRIALAERWMESAQKFAGDERALIGASRASQASDA